MIHNPVSVLTGSPEPTGDAHTPGTDPLRLRSELNALRITDDWAVQAADLMFEAARSLHCSDLHISCRRHDVLIRGRKDGQFFAFAEIRSEVKDLLLGRLKVLAQLPAFVRHEPQDGRIRWNAPDGKTVILRCSFLPTIHGESVVIRFPEMESWGGLELDRLGMETQTLAAVKRVLARRDGVISITGPSSSGKTTTMYAMLRHLHEQHGNRLNIVAIEDPPERELDFANQVAVNVPQGLTYDKALRAALRQDPNILMIGEARDAETARIAIQAGMTGHLVITTVHAGRANRVFSRLLSMGVEPHLVASAMNGSIAQRLVRRLCAACKGSGCDACDQLGSNGRIGLYEAIPVDEDLRDLIAARASSDEIARRAAAVQVGCLHADARRLADTGVISVAEYEFLFSEEQIT